MQNISFQTDPIRKLSQENHHANSNRIIRCKIKEIIIHLFKNSAAYFNTLLSLNSTHGYELQTSYLCDVYGDM